MIVKLHKSFEGRTILAVCDSELIGKKFEEGDLQLDLSGGFYKGEEMSEEKIVSLFKVVNVVNLVGEEAVALGKEIGIVEKVIVIDGIPHAEALIVEKE